MKWPDVMYGEGLLAVTAKLKGGKMRYVPLLPEVADELRRYPAVISDDLIFPPRKGALGKRRRLEGSFEDLLKRARIRNFRFRDLRPTFAPWCGERQGDVPSYVRYRCAGRRPDSETDHLANMAFGKRKTLHEFGPHSRGVPKKRESRTRHSNESPQL